MSFPAWKACREIMDQAEKLRGDLERFHVDLCATDRSGIPAKAGFKAAVWQGKNLGDF